MIDGQALAVFQQIIVVLLGLCLGSFATALAYRLPRGESMVAKKRSACPSCARNLSVVDLVPVFSWACLRGKCRQCKAPIGWQYPLIEVATLILCCAFHLRFGFTAQSFCLFAMAPALVAMADIDFRFKLIPDKLNLAVLILGVVALFAGAVVTGEGPDFIVERGQDAVLGFLLYGFGSFALRQAAAYVLKRDPMGLGDVKFFAAAGFWLGPSLETLGFFLFLSGACGIVIALVWKKVSKDREFPFGPALLAAFIALLFSGASVIL